MIIGIDFRLANTSNRGMARYCKEIVKELLCIDNCNEYILYIDKDMNADLLYLKQRCKIRRLPCHNFIIGEQFFLAYYTFIDKLNFLWSPYNTFPVFASSKTKLLVTVHDLIFCYNINKKYSLYQYIGRSYRKLILSVFKKKIYHCFTVSRFSKSEIARLLKIENVSITYNCINQFLNTVKLFKIQNINCVKENFVFTVSGDSPSKNIELLISIFENELSNKKIVIAGVHKKSKLRDSASSNIHFLECGVSDSVLIEYYLKCRLFLFVSLYEGFGIPVLEALTCGCNIIASNTTSIPEVLGTCGIMVDPLNRIDIVNTIKQNWKSFPLISDEVKTSHLNKFLKWSNSARTIHSKIVEV